MIDVVAKDVPDLLAQIDGRTVRVQGADAHARHPRRGPRGRSCPTGGTGCSSVITASERRADPDDDRHLRPVLRVRRARAMACRAWSARSACCWRSFALQLLPVNYAGAGADPARHGAAGGRVVRSRPSACWAPAASIALRRRRRPAVRQRRARASACRWPLIARRWRPRRRRSSCSAAAWRSRRVAGPWSAAAKSLVGAAGEVLEVTPMAKPGPRSWASAGRWPATGPLAPGQRVRVLGLRGLTLEVQADARNQYQ